MKPGNRHVNEMVPIHTKLSALGDERKDNYFVCLSAHVRKAFYILLTYFAKVFLLKMEVEDN